MSWRKSIGPGLVYGLTVLGTGDIVSNSAAGASYRYSLIWALGMALVFRYVWVNASAKYVLVSGESLLTGYGRVARWVPWLVILSFIPMRYLANTYLVLMMGTSVHMLLPLPVSWSIQAWATIFTVAGFGLAFWGGYPVIETLCKFLVGVMALSLIVAALLADPDPREILRGTLVPRLPPAQGLYSSMLIVLALIGTEAGSYANLTYAYFITEKGWKGASYLRRQRVDLAVGAISLFVMGALLQIAAAGTIHPLGIQVQDPQDLGGIFWETQGVVGLLVFTMGLWGSAFSTFVGLNMGIGLILTDVCRTFVPGLKKSPAERTPSVKKDPIYRYAILFWSFAPLLVFFTQARAVWLVLVTAGVSAVLIPVLGLSLLKITNDRKLLGQHRNGGLTNSILVMLVVLALYFGYRNGLDLWTRILGQ